MLFNELISLKRKEKEFTVRKFAKEKNISN